MEPVRQSILLRPKKDGNQTSRTTFAEEEKRLEEKLAYRREQKAMREAPLLLSCTQSVSREEKNEHVRQLQKDAQEYRERIVTTSKHEIEKERTLLESPFQVGDYDDMRRESEYRRRMSGISEENQRIAAKKELDYKNRKQEDDAVERKRVESNAFYDRFGSSLT